MAYFVLLVNYGFDLSATRTISVQRDNPKEVAHTASAVLGAKILLAVLSFIILSLLIAVVPRFRDISAMLYILFGIVIGNALFPQWLFQGLERMVAISVINLAMRVLTTAGIFLLIRQPEDFLKYAGLLGAQWAGAGLMGLGWAVLGLRVRLRFPSFTGILGTLREGWTIFLSTVVISFYTTSNAFILGLLTNYTIVGYYTAAEKIVLSVSGLLGPISQAVYPRFNKLASETKIHTLSFGKKILLLMSQIGIFLTMAILLFAPTIAEVMLGPNYERSITVMRILAPWIFINAITNVWGIQIMLPFGYDRAFFTILLIAGLMNVCLSIPLASVFYERGMAMSVLISITFVAIAQPMYLWRKAKITPWLK
jgi:PST family polysaccharide transporter